MVVYTQTLYLTVAMGGLQASRAEFVVMRASHDFQNLTGKLWSNSSFLHPAYTLVMGSILGW